MAEKNDYFYRKENEINNFASEYDWHKDKLEKEKNKLIEKDSEL